MNQPLVSCRECDNFAQQSASRLWEQGFGTCKVESEKNKGSRAAVAATCKSADYPRQCDTFVPRKAKGGVA